MKISYETLLQRRSLPLEAKEVLALSRIKDFCMMNDYKIYVAFSGGLDSTVLLHLVRRFEPSIQAVFSNTGLEYPETVDFVKTFSNVEMVYPKKSFLQVIREYGYPVITKEVSKNISRYKNTIDPLQKEYRLYGTKNGKPVLTKKGKKAVVGVIPQKWHYLINAPFKISDMCCDILKKNPMYQYEKRTGNKPFVGTMAIDSNRRKMDYLRTGCNSFEKGKEKSTPLGYWTREDVIAYVQKYNLSTNPVYAMGEKHTGCIFCCFGCHMEEEPNRFQRMQQHHGKLWDYCRGTLGLQDVLKFIGVKYNTEVMVGDSSPT